MAFDQRLLNRIAADNEAKAAKHLRGLGVDVERIREGPRKRPDYLLRDRSSKVPVAIVEVKTIFSAGVGPDGTHHSTLDPASADKVREMPAVSPNYRSAFEDAVEQYQSLIADVPECRGLPFLVAFISDFFAGPTLLDRRQPEFPEVTGYLVLVENRDMLARANRMSMRELERRLDSGDGSGLPPPAKEWRFLANPHASIPLPPHLRLACLEGYPEDRDRIPPTGAIDA